LNRSGESGYPCLVLDFWGNGFSFSTFSMMLDISLSYIAFVMLRCIAFIPSFIRAFIMKGYWISLKVFFLHLLRWSCCFVFASVNMLYYIQWSTYVEPSLHPWNETDLIMVYDLFDMLLNSVCQYFIEDFCTDVH
jgi:hypothetical protein